MTYKWSTLNNTIQLLTGYEVCQTNLRIYRHKLHLACLQTLLYLSPLNLLETLNYVDILRNTNKYLGHIEDSRYIHTSLKPRTKYNFWSS